MRTSINPSRFNGFMVETVETVLSLKLFHATSLKRGVNERACTKFNRFCVGLLTSNPKK